jgi:[ribosomal protein S18]-alanine N-acetyltransferase
MRIRPAAPGDVPGVVALEADLFGPDAWSAEVAAAELTRPDRRAVVTCTEGGSTPHGGRLDGAEGGSVVVGYAVTRVSGDLADLHRIGVTPTLQRTGLGHALLEEVRRAAGADGATRLLLEVSAGNTAARAFYAAEGFEEIDRRRRYYRDGSDALVLEGSLPAPACGTAGGRTCGTAGGRTGGRTTR